MQPCDSKKRVPAGTHHENHDRSCLSGIKASTCKAPRFQPNSASSSPCEKAVVEGVTKRKYRTFSFDGMMLRNGRHKGSNEGTSERNISKSMKKSSNYGSTQTCSNERKALLPRRKQNSHGKKMGKTFEKNKTLQMNEYFYYLVYAIMNTMMSVPSLYGYASVIFNHVAFQPYISTLSKLVIWSSAVHQLCFVLFSSIPFAKAEVQDAGLLFLSCITQYIADMILAEDGTIEEILSTTVVALGIATTALGSMLILLAVFNCANIVSYLPLPVVGGYLAFIGYFCIVAGIGLCISKSMIDGTLESDIKILCDAKPLILALPGLGAALLMMLVTRYTTSDIALPATMVTIPILFYLVLYFSGCSMDDARRNQWIGEESSTASLSNLFDCFDMRLVRWDLIFSLRCITVWIGMVFVVSFSSCLDVAAISMDMGEPLNMNKELKTVGLSNVMSGLCLGQTGSYIFSQTILTYRTGFHSRWIGVLGVLMFLYFALSKVNLLDVTPLFFLGSTLIFIGIDLLYEWIIEVSKKLLLSEYLVLLATFIAIHFVGIDGGIIFGILVAIVEYVITSSQLPSLRRVLKQSRAIWGQQQRQFIQDVVYDSRHPLIITLEITETVFFGSSLLVFSQICNEIGLSATTDELYDFALNSPRMHSFAIQSPRTQPPEQRHGEQRNAERRLSCSETLKHRPRFVVLEMNQVANVDASAARSCFLQLAKMCSKNGMMLCAAGANSRVQWVFRSHDISYTSDEEEVIKGMMLNPYDSVRNNPLPSGKLILFTSVNECLELCETQLINEQQHSNGKQTPKLGLASVVSDVSSRTLMYPQDDKFPKKIQLSKIFERILGMEDSMEKELLKSFDEGGSANVEELTLGQNEKIFSVDDVADCFFVVLRGCVRICRKLPQEDVQVSTMLQSSLERQVSYVNEGQIFGYVDFALERRRSFNAVCSKFGTIVAKLSRSEIDRLKHQSIALHHIIDKVLLQASLMELANLDIS